MSLPQGSGTITPPSGCGCRTADRDGEAPHCGELARTGRWRNSTFPAYASCLPLLLPRTEVHTHIFFLSPFLTDADTLESTSLNEETAIPVPSSCPPLACAVLGSCSRPTRKYAILSLVAGFFFFFFFEMKT